MTGPQVFGNVGSIGQSGGQKPSVGRLVHLYIFAKDNDGDDAPQQLKGPYAALVVYVHDDQPPYPRLNLRAYGFDGTPFNMANVALVQDHEPKPHYGCYCVWPPRV